ncbi:MAG: pre-peptidase C-terminal domain-containing protein [Planctomycetes bacterium]|nr:pre-peptidase C-terminal domain-containing protein [Planctomycetota bacterium]
MRFARSSLAATLLPLLFLAAAPAQTDDHSGTYSSGTWLSTDGRAVAGRIDFAGDRDWFRLSVVTGDRYEVRTANLTAEMDSVIALFAPSGARVGYDDDSGGGRASYLAWTATASGTAYLALLHYSSTGLGGYQVLATRTPASPAPAPTPTDGGGGNPAPGTIAGPKVFDPKLAGASCSLAFGVPGSGTQTATLVVLDAAGQTVATPFPAGSVTGGQTLSARWDGRTSAGSFASPGSYRAALKVGGQTIASLPVAVVRLGAVQVAWQGTGRVPLLYHRSDPAAVRSYLPVDSIGSSWSLATSTGSLDATNGTPLAAPSIWTDTRTPPRTSSGAVATRGVSLPVAYASGGARSVRITLGSRAYSASGTALTAGYPVSGLPIRVVVEGVPSGEVSPGAAVTLTLAPRTGGVGREDRSIDVRFQYSDGGVWRDVPGSQTFAQRFYTLLRQPALLPSGAATGAPYVSWVWVVDRVAAWSAGSATTDTGVLDQVTRKIYGTQSLYYDDQSGAPAYSDGSPTLSTFDLAAYDLRRYGSLVNCTDCANLVSIHARMVGVDARNVYLGSSFPLHWIKGIGRNFTHSLFGGNHAFSFHMIASATGGSRVHDATLALDGDGDPANSPSSELIPLGLPFQTYHDLLTPGSFQALAQDRSRFE